MRIQIRLTSVLPLVKILEISFTEQPKIDFILKPLKSLDLMDMPGLSNWLNSLINGILETQLVNPNVLTINLEAGFNSSFSSRKITNFRYWSDKSYSLSIETAKD